MTIYLLCRTGKVLELNNQEAKITNAVTSGIVMIDGLRNRRCR